MRALRAATTAVQRHANYVQLLLCVVAELAYVALLPIALHGNPAPAVFGRLPAFKHISKPAPTYEVLPALRHFFQLAPAECAKGSSLRRCRSPRHYCG